MNVGTDWAKALDHALANANWDGRPRWVHWYGGFYWISRTPVDWAKKIDPDR